MTLTGLKVGCTGMAAGFILGVSGAAAATLQDAGEICANNQVTVNGQDATDCDGAFQGNNLGNNAETLLDGLFNVADWTVLATDDKPGTGGPNGSIGLSATAGTSGTWSVSSWGPYSQVMIVVKGSNDFAAYLIDTSFGTSGTFSTAALQTGGCRIAPNSKPNNGGGGGNGGGNGGGGNGGGGGNSCNDPELSHITIYAPVATVPVPAAGFLLLGGLGGLVALRRRWKAV